jgi:hypothetical protein
MNMGKKDIAIKYLQDAESRESSRDINMHTYDRLRHNAYKALLVQWGAKPRNHPA